MVLPSWIALKIRKDNRDNIAKCDNCFIAKCEKSLLQNASGFLLQNVAIIKKCVDFVTKYDGLYKTQCLLQNASALTVTVNAGLTHFKPLLPFYTPYNTRKWFHDVFRSYQMDILVRHTLVERFLNFVISLIKICAHVICHIWMKYF